MTPRGQGIQLETAARRRQVVALLLAGATQAEAARALGVEPTTLSNDVAAIRQQWREEHSGDIEALVQQEVARLNRLQMTHWDNALRGSIPATEICLKISDRRRKLLGLDAPEQHAVSVTNDTTLEDLSSRLAQLAAAVTAEPGTETQDTEGGGETAP